MKRLFSILALMIFVSTAGNICMMGEVGTSIVAEPNPVTTVPISAEPDPVIPGVEPLYTEADREAIDAYLYNPDPTTAPINLDMVSPKGYVTLMVQVNSGMRIALEVDVLNFPVYDDSVIEINTSDGIYVVLDEDGEAVQVPISDVSTYLTNPEEETLYFCRRSDGDESGGPIVKALMNVTINGETRENVAVNLRRDPLEQSGQQIMANADTAQSEMVWVISWFSDDCERNEDGDCPPDRCGVSLSSLIKLAAKLGLQIPDDPTIDGLLDLILLEKHLQIGGRCGEVYFLGIFNVGCQCILVELF